MKLSTLRLPLGLGIDGSLATISGRDRVLQGVAIYFLTRRGSRAMVPEFGVPELPTYPEEVPAWNAEAEAGLLMVQGVVAARVMTVLNRDNILTGKATVKTDGQEELDYDFKLGTNA